jgi:hypothetical protein
MARRLKPPGFGDALDGCAKRRRAADKLDLFDAARLVD